MNKYSNKSQEYQNYQITLSLKKNIEASDKESALNLFKECIPNMKELSLITGISMTLDTVEDNRNTNNPDIRCSAPCAKDDSKNICCTMCTQMDYCDQRCTQSPKSCNKATVYITTSKQTEKMYDRNGVTSHHNHGD